MKVVSICSARPNFVKLAAVHHALAANAPEVEHCIVHTGQHYDPLFSDIFFQQLTIPHPAHNLGIHGMDREEMIARTEQAFAALLPFLQPDIVLVYGDVNGAVGAARATHKAGIRLAHIEAGLRSFDASMPEEWNRIAIDELADHLFCTEEAALKNLQTEEASGQVHLVGNTMIDTLLRMLPLVEAEPNPVSFGQQYAVVTLHRPSNVDTDEALRQNMAFLGELSQSMPLILPAHHRLASALERSGLLNSLPSSITLLPPLAYVPFLRLVKDATFILTDSGGIQEEAVILGKRCFTLRRNTERPSTIQSGSNVLIDPEQEASRKLVLDYATQPAEPQIAIPMHWDGRAGERIVRVLSGAL